MKSQFLKIAGVKSEKAFYKKYPTEAAFFKAHPEAKKMVNGGVQDKGQIKKLQQLTDFGNPPKAWPGIDIDGDGIDDQDYGSGSVYGQPTYNPATTAVGGINPNAKNAYQAATGNIGDALKATDFIQPGLDVIKGIGMLGQQKKAKKEAKQNAKLTGVIAQAAQTREEPIRRQYVRPEDVIVQPEQLFPSYGVGTNVLAEDGAMIGGNPTEIMNTFAPDTIYTDMGYEPLNDTSRIKAYYHGGKLTKAQNGLSAFLNKGGFADFMNQGGGNALGRLTSQVGSAGYGPTAGNAIGGGLGQAAGTIFGGPVGGMIGKALGNVVGGFIDPTGRQIKEYNDLTNQNIGSIVGQQFGQGIQRQFSSYLEDGGYVSNDWTPQVIATFGEHKLKDLLQPPNDADMLRAGGHLRSYTPPSAQAMYTGREQLAMGGDLKVHRGEAETMSYNPYLPDGGETIMFRGPSHENGGMPIEYGSSPVEVEGGEPAVKLQDGGTGEDNMVVFGNLKIPNQFLSEIGDDKAKGKKFKNYVADLSKIEAKQNKIIDNSSNGLDNLDLQTSFDKLKLDSYNANLIGANMKLKEIAEKKKNAAAVQNAINDTAEENGLVADDLARGKIKMDKSKEGKAKYGAAIEKAQAGTYKKKGIQPGMIDYNEIGTTDDPLFANKETYEKKWIPKMLTALNDPQIADQILKSLENYSGQDAEDVKAVLSKLPTKSAKLAKMYELASDYKPGPFHTLLNGLIDKTVPTPIITTGETTTVPVTTTTIETTKGKFPWMPLINQAIDYLRPSDAEALDPNQLMGEFYALTNNQLEPVQAQKYTPQLLSPYDISLQDQLNANQADFNAIAKMTGGDSSVLPALAAQKYAANSKVLGEQMRLNQANKAGIYSQNINALNDAQLRNLNILDQQYGRQAQAKSNTKATTQAALNSISSKIAQNKLSNRTLATYENLYNYRYNPNFRAENMNPLAQFDTSTASGAEIQAMADYKKAQEAKAAKEAKKTSNSRNGSIVKALKNL
jgi:hypothetical protein